MLTHKFIGCFLCLRHWLLVRKVTNKNRNVEIILLKITFLNFLLRAGVWDALTGVRGRHGGRFLRRCHARNGWELCGAPASVK
ncbi:hypothetical protein HMPREF9136_1702 [Prevotella dentalis DSM 3688]|uniref:Uncharacterized protein n=1 Tax=Prevotella dentalis (strain ATCC 49559 / DSM 3688 / JCM 13448 / NCTC 12043 / ES 2772) TaxID=908937 RepID=F9D4C4_PREDD|nr:hypothetical protein HMPREF9136_1702 [Prevotella dentalis DSM 3688]